MKTKFFILVGLLLILAVSLSGCATGAIASGWPGITVDAQNAYVSGGSYVYAVNLQTGAQVWRYPDKASSNPFDAAPVLTSDGQLIVGGYDKVLYSLNPQTGAVNWQYKDARDRWLGPVLVTDEMIYAPNADYKLYALNLQGQFQWSFEADESIWAAPVSDGKNVYFGTLGRQVYAVSMSTHKQVWVQKVDGAILGSPVLGADNALYVGTYGGSIYVLNAATGSARSLVATSSWIWSGPVLAGNTLYFGDGSGSLYAQPLGTSGQTWKQALNGAIVGLPLVTADNVIVGTEAGNLYIMDRTGKNPRPISIPGKMYASPVAAGNLILVAPTGKAAATDPVLIALDLTGAIKWSFIPPK